MSFFLVFLSIILSFTSTCLMSYLAMAITIAPWVAPVFVMVLMILLLQVVNKEWFKHHVVVGIAAGSLGGMVGMCLGLTWPSLYFLHKETFLLWMQSPWKFAGTISLLVFAAGSFAFLIANFLRYHLIVECDLKFPMSRLVHDIVYVDNQRRGVMMMLNGLVVSSSWNIFTWIARVPFHAYTSQLHTIPIFLSIGFVAGQLITIPLFIGLCSRIVALTFLKNDFFQMVKEQEFILTFSSGMLLGLVSIVVLSYLLKVFKNKTGIAGGDLALLVSRVLKHRLYLGCLFFSVLLCCAVLYSWNVSWIQQLYVLISLFFLCSVVAFIVGEVGVVEVQSFVNFIILPFTYFFFVSSMSALVIIVFCTVCVGVVVDLFFSYKLAHLAKIPYMRILKYQLLGFFVAATCVGFILWWYIYVFKLGSTHLLAEQALSQEILITFANYNYKILAMGFAYVAVLSFFCKEILVIIGGIMMPVSMSFWLILAGGFSYFIKKREQFYPFWFGVYASHSLWMIIRVLMLRG